MGGVHLRATRTAQRQCSRSPACRPPSCAPPPACTRRLRTVPSTTASGVTEHSQGSTMVMGMANLAMACGNIGRDGVGVNPLRGQNNVQGSCDMGSFPHELQRLSARVRRRGPSRLRKPLGNNASARARACASRTCSTPRSRAPSGDCSSTARTSRSPTRTSSMSPPHWARWSSWSCRTCSSTRPRSSPTCFCRVRRSWRRTAPSPTRSAGSTGSVR